MLDFQHDDSTAGLLVLCFLYLTDNLQILSHKYYVFTWDEERKPKLFKWYLAYITNVLIYTFGLMSATNSSCHSQKEPQFQFSETIKMILYLINSLPTSCKTVLVNGYRKAVPTLPWKDTVQLIRETMLSSLITMLCVFTCSITQWWSRKSFWWPEGKEEL